MPCTFLREKSQRMWDKGRKKLRSIVSQYPPSKNEDLGDWGVKESRHQNNSRIFKFIVKYAIITTFCLMEYKS